MYRCVVTKPCLFVATACAALLLILPVAGCGGGHPQSLESLNRPRNDTQQIIHRAGAITSGKGEWEWAFAEGAAPTGKEERRFLKYLFNTGEVKIDGDQATIQVEVTDYTSNPVGKTEWKLKKINDEWRVTEAPLPDSAK